MPRGRNQSNPPEQVNDPNNEVIAELNADIERQQTAIGELQSTLTQSLTAIIEAVARLEARNSDIPSALSPEATNNVRASIPPTGIASDQVSANAASFRQSPNFGSTPGV